MIALAGTAALLALALPLGPAAVQGTVSAEGGVEYDSNANRAEADGPEPPQPSPLLRFLADGHLLQQGGRHRLSLQFSAGGKVFFLPEVQDQNIGVVKLAYVEGVQLSRVRLSGVLDYYDAYQAPSAEPLLRSRDFRAADTGLRLQGGAPLSGRHAVEGSLDVTGEFFQYKPDSSYTFIAPSALGRLLFRLHAGDPELGHDFELALSAQFDYRGFLYARLDDFLQVGATASWVGPVLLQAGYGAQVNESSAPCQSYARHLALAKLAARIPGDLYLTIKGQLNLLSLLNAMPTAQIDCHSADVMQPVPSIDEENRSFVAVDLERPLPRGFSLSARYSAYFELPGDMLPAYQRHTVYLGVSYRYRKR